MSNNADKRSVSTDALETLGTIIGPNEKRDAIHLAVDPVIATHYMEPGQDVGLLSPGYASEAAPHIGIVDPFLRAPVQKGERFWLVVYPRQITSLRHVWSHPAFEDEPERLTITEQKKEFIKELDGTNVSRRWIEAFAIEVGLNYDELMAAAAEWVASQREGSWGEYLNKGPLLEGVSVPDDFWRHYGKVTGDVVEQQHQGSFFTCSC
jgi:hypothetical protein